MLRFLRAALVLLSLSMSWRAPQVAHAAGWQLVFSEDFSGSALDRQRWATRYIFENEQCDTFPANGEQQRYRDNQNHVLTDGTLALVARRVASTPKDASEPTDKPTLDYESGLLRSYQTFYYGYFEARVKTPKAAGTWPAFWLAADRDGDGNIAWPPEIDIFDNANNGKDATGSMIHSGGVTGKEAGAPQGGKLVQADKQVDTDGIYHGSTDLTGAWHVYGLLWTPDEITLWLDGKLIYIKTYKWLRNDGKLAGPAHLLLNLAVGGPWAGRFGVDERAFPQRFEVDYVHVCQIDVGSDSGALCGGSKLTPDPNKYAYSTDGAGNDLTRPALHDVQLSSKTLQHGDTLKLTHRISSAVSSGEPHDVYQYIVDARGQTVMTTKLVPTVPSTQWAGRTIRLTNKIPIARDVPAGTYRIYLAVGSPEAWDPEGKTSLRSLTLQYAPDATLRERIGQPTRYKVGEVVVRQ